MPSGDPLYANDFNEVLKKKHSSGTYKEMVNSCHHLISFASYLCTYDKDMMALRW